jgi:rare lipoprotein A
MNRSPALVRIALATIVLTLSACSNTPKKPTPPAAARRVQSPPPATAQQRAAARRSPYAPAQEDPSKRGDYTRGGLYAPHIQDSAPGGLADVDLIPEPEVTNEPRARYGNRSPYVVLGKSYAVLPSAEGYDETGIASFYGNKFHGRRTSSLEVYDMYAFSAAHKTLPLPSFARVTNLANGKSVIVRVNDRGPFHDGRIIDLSYAAAVKLGVDRTGTARVEVRGLGGGENARND